MKIGITKILLTGGGSGGHVYPLIAVVQALKRIVVADKIPLELVYLGPTDAYSALLKKTGVATYSIPAGKIRRYLSLLILLDIPRFFLGLLAALWRVYWLMPEAIFSKGGTGALPVVIAGWFYRIPIIIHESDAKPGLNNLLSAPFASRVATSFESALKYFKPKKTAWIGAPIREELLAERPPKEEAKRKFGFNPGEPLILILGGSLGSDRINKFIVANLAAIAKETQVLHQTGEANFAEIEKLSRAALADWPREEKARYKAVPYFREDIEPAFAAADLVVSRAGSGTIFETAALSKPAMLIPLRESANGHQRENAYEFARSGGAVVIEEQNLLPGIFISQLKIAIKNKATLEKMGLASGRFFKPKAAEIIARELLRLAQN